MKLKKAYRVLLGLFILIVATSFKFDSYPLRFSPVGTWEYSVPGVEAGYEKGSMLIVREDREYKVTMVLNEFSKTEAEKVVYKRKNISFTIWVENEEIFVSGTFDGDHFRGTISYSEGDFNLTATRAP